jgi:soluble lytic murein transglycosylase-like protein
LFKKARLFLTNIHAESSKEEKMKRWVFAQAVMMAAIVWTCWLIKIQLTPVAQAREVPKFEIYIQLSDNRLVPYRQVKIVPIPKPVIPQSAQLQGLTKFQAEVYRLYNLYLGYGTGLKYLKRLEKYNQVIERSARYLGLDSDLARGLISVESMGIPDIVSRENAVGFTQILTVPFSCRERVKKILGVNQLDPFNPEHNIWLGLETLREYTQLKDNDLLLGLVSYNYGPNQQSVLRANNWEDFQASEDVKAYPIKVMAVTLLSKVSTKYGRALPYNVANRAKIEKIVLPR